MSPRQQVAQSLADTCIFGNLNDSYGVSVRKALDKGGKEFWSVIFAKARTLDGAISVYSPNFILIHWQGSLAVSKGLPFDGKQVFRNEHSAKEFLVNSFIRN